MITYINLGFFSNFQYGFRSTRSTADLLTVVSDRISKAFNRSEATRDVALDIFKAFNISRLSQTQVLWNFRSDTWSYIFFSPVIHGFGWFWMVSFNKMIQLMLEFLKGSFLMMLSVILLSMLRILPSALYVIRHLIYGNN